MITQPYVCGDLDDIPWVMSGPVFVLVGSQKERLTVEDPAWNNVDRYSAAVLVSFQAYDIRRK